MATYKYGNKLTQVLHDAFDVQHLPGATALHAGIYRCMACGDEIGIAKGHTLPPQNHKQHAPNSGPIRWQLLVYAEQRS